MIRMFAVKNYRNFKDELVLDFTHTHDYKYNDCCIKNGLINKAIVYGKNSVGKSNLGIALYDIFYNAISMFSYRFLKTDEAYKNADAASDELIEFFYSFSLDGDIVDYKYCKTDATTIVSEKFSLNGELIFEYNALKNEYNFSNVSKINAGGVNWNDFIKNMTGDEDSAEDDAEKPTALRYIIHNTIQFEPSVIYKLSKFIRGMRFANSSLNISKNIIQNKKYLLEEGELDKFQKFLNLYGVECKLILLDQPDGEKEIYFDHKKPLHFIKTMSSGTAELTRFYLKYMCGGRPTFIYIDEFDAFYHFELSENIVKLLEEVFDCQVILTSHNTNLLSNSIMRPDCFMILDKGKLTPICEATTRELRQGHNLEKLYMNGEFNT